MFTLHAACRCRILTEKSFTFNANKYDIKLIYFPICSDFERNMD